MAHFQQRQFFERLRSLRPDLFDGVSVVEIGSLDINGTVRDFFKSDNYVGVDVGAGPGVDVVANGADLEYEDRSFDVAVSAECFEHNPDWVATFANMHRMADKAVIMTCASEGRPEHGTKRSHPGSSPLTLEWEYYKNLTRADFMREFELSEMFSEHWFEYNEVSQDLYFFGLVK